MQTIPGYPDPTHVVTEPVGQVAWRSDWWPVTEIEVVRELGAGLPEQVAGTDGFVAATATVTMTTKGMVTEGLHLPWDDGRPKRGDAMDVYTGLGDKRRRVIKGMVDEVHGDVTDPTLEVVVVDRIDQLNRPISIDPLNFRMPPHFDGGQHRLIGLHPTYLTDRIARQCGFYSTPQLEAGSWISAPMVGSVWPERGNLLQSGTIGTPAPPTPVFTDAPWGLAVTNTYASYEPVLSGVPGPLGLRLSHPTYDRFLIGGPIGTSAFRHELDWGGGHRYIVHVNKDRLSIDQFNDEGGNVGGGNSRMSAPLPPAVNDEWDISIWFEPVNSSADGSDVNVRVQINNQVTTGILWATPVMKGSNLNRVQVYSDGASAAMGGVQIGSALSRYDLHAWTRTALYDTDYYSDYWSGVPGIVGQTGLELLKDQANKSLGALWIDSDARLRYKSMERLLGAPVSGETITIRNLADLQWSESGGSIYETVKATWKMPTANRGIYQTAHLWQANSVQIARGEVYEEVIHPESDVDWIDVAPIFKLPNNNEDPQDAERWSRWMNGIGTWVSAVLESEDNETGIGGIEHVPVSWYDVGFWKIDPRSYRVRVEPTAANLIGNERVLSLRSAGHGYLPEHRRAQPTPLVRGRARVQWDEHEAIGATRGPQGAGEYVHDAAFWVQNRITGQPIADYIAAKVSTPVPVLHDVDVTPDDRRDLTDVYRVQLGGTTLRTLCIRIKDTITSDPVERTQTLTLQQIEKE